MQEVGVWLRALWDEGQHVAVKKMLATLTYREREIIKLRFGIGDGYTYTLEEVGKIFKVTRERIRSVCDKGLKKLSVCREKMTTERG